MTCGGLHLYLYFYVFESIPVVKSELSNRGIVPTSIPVVKSELSNCGIYQPCLNNLLSAILQQSISENQYLLSNLNHLIVVVN